jgi:hypothetical protein
MLWAVLPDLKVDSVPKSRAARGLKHSGYARSITVRFYGAMAPRAICAAIIGTCVCAGCGHVARPGITRSAFAARADRICARALKAAGRLGAPDSREQSLTFTEAASAIVDRTVNELSQVKAPASELPAYSRFIQDTRHEATMLRELVAALKTGDSLLARTKTQDLRSDVANDEARALGLKECARAVNPGSNS